MPAEKEALFANDRGSQHLAPASELKSPCYLPIYQQSSLPLDHALTCLPSWFLSTQLKPAFARPHLITSLFNLTLVQILAFSNLPLTQEERMLVYALGLILHRNSQKISYSLHNC